MVTVIDSLFKNKWFWFIIIAIILFFVIRKNWESLRQKLFQTKNPTYLKDDQGNYIAVTELDKNRINILVDKTRDEIYDLRGMDPNTLQIIYDLTDQELEYFGKRYKTVYSDSFYTDLDDEYLPFTSLDDKIQSRLIKLGLNS